jgi:2-iminobutanoate/2-iminopropanoate deaminase
VACGRAIFVSGQIALDPQTGEIVGKTAGQQTKQVMDNISEILRESEADLSKVVRATIFLANIDDFGAVNEMYSTYFDTDPPARSTVEVSRLPKDAKVEIDVIAYI